MVLMLIPIFKFYLDLQEIQKILAKKIYKQHVFIVQKHSFTATIFCTMANALLKHLRTSKMVVKEQGSRHTKKPPVKQTQEE